MPAAAVAAYRGELLPGVYDDWLLDARAQLGAPVRGAVRPGLPRPGPERGDLAGAVETARRRVQLQPLEEAGYRTLMQVQADMGDRAGAVSTYHRCASVLERELGVLPDPVTRAGVPALMADARPASRPPARRSGVGPPGLGGGTASWPGR